MSKYKRKRLIIDGRKTHDEWWVVANYGGAWVFESSCRSKEDAEKILTDYKNVPAVKECGIKKLRIDNMEGI